MMGDDDDEEDDDIDVDEVENVDDDDDVKDEKDAKIHDETLLTSFYLLLQKIKYSLSSFVENKGKCVLPTLTIMYDIIDNNNKNNNAREISHTIQYTIPFGILFLLYLHI